MGLAWVWVLVVAGACPASQVKPPDPPDPHGRLVTAYRSAKVYEPYGRTLSVLGAPMTRGAQPDEAARGFLREHADVFGSDLADLVFDREIELVKDRAVVFYHQQIDGHSVEGSSVRVMTQGSDPAAVIYAAARVAKRPRKPFPAPGVTRAQALEAAKAHAMAAGLTQWTQPRLVAEYDDAPVGDGVARLVYRCAGSLGRSQSYTFTIDPATGQVRSVGSNILRAFPDVVSGSVTGKGSPSIADHRRPDRNEGIPNCDNPAVELALPYVRVQAWDQSPTPVLIDETFADRFGDYSLSVQSGLQVDVKVALVGPAWEILDDSVTPTPVVGTVSVTSPATGTNLLLNASPVEFATSQVNAFLNVEKTWTYFHDRLPIQPPIMGLDFPVARIDVNDAFEFLTCSGTYIEWLDLISFARLGTSGPPLSLYCQNMAYSTVVSHEYGHRILSLMLGHTAGGHNIGAFHEGYADLVAFMTHDTDVLGEDFAKIPCGTHIREPLGAGVTYPACSNDSHLMGQVLGAIWLRMRQDSAFPLLDLRQLFVDWSFIAEPPPFHPTCTVWQQAADPGTLVETLIADDDDGDLSNGTPHCRAILNAFAAQKIYPPVEIDCPGDSPSSNACTADCDQSTGAGVLDIFDFLCFQDAFVAQSAGACDCDTSTGAGVCDVFDFVCFQSAFTHGCVQE